MSSANLLRLNNISKHFHVGSAVIHAVEGVTLDVRARVTTAVVGESGSGKTTLGNMILGIESPSSGTIEYEGAPLPGRRTKDLRRKISVVQQNPYSTLNPRLSVGHAVSLPLLVHNIGSRRDRWKVVRSLLERVGLHPELANRSPLALSGGQRQRVAIARALATQPDLIVLDEPTSSLDVSVQAHILKLLSELQKDLGLTYVFITHDLAVVRAMAKHVVVMYRGRVVEYGTVESVFSAPRHRYTNLLLASIPTVSEDDDRYKPDWPWDHVAQVDAMEATGCAFRARCPFAIERCGNTQPHLTSDGDHWHACFNPAQSHSSASLATSGGGIQHAHRN